MQNHPPPKCAKRYPYQLIPRINKRSADLLQFKTDIEFQKRLGRPQKQITRAGHVLLQHSGCAEDPHVGEINEHVPAKDDGHLGEARNGGLVLKVYVMPLDTPVKSEIDPPAFLHL